MRLKCDDPTICSSRSLRTKEKAIHRQLYLAMLIQVVIRLILYTDQYVSRKGSKDDSGSPGNDTEYYQESNKGIDNTVLLLKMLNFSPFISQSFLQPYLCESFYILLEYARTAMFHWFFIEGLHLHNVLTIDVFPAGDGTRRY